MECMQLQSKALFILFQVGAVMNCADNTGAKNLFILSVKGIKVCWPSYVKEQRRHNLFATGPFE